MTNKLLRETDWVVGTVPNPLPQHRRDGEYVVTGDENPLPTGGYVMTPSGVWVPQAGTEEGAVKTELNGSNIENLISNQRKITNILNSDKLIFGVYWDKSSDPTLTRTDDAVGLEANVGVDGELVKNDFDRMPIFGEMHEAEDEYGNRFTRIPKFYIQKVGGKNHLIKRVSKTRYPGFYLPWIFWDFEKNEELEYYDHGKYKGSLSADGKLESKFGTIPTAFRNIVQIRNDARNNNDANAGLTGYQQLDIHAQDVLETLIHIEFATLDSQSVMRGLVSGVYSDSHTITLTEQGVNRAVVSNATAGQFVVGQSISIGSSRGNTSVVHGRTVTDINVVDESNQEIVFDGDSIDVTEGNVIWSSGWRNGFSADIAASSGSIGDNTSGRYPCMYRGIESPWGDLWQFVDGVNINNHQAWVSKDANNYASNVLAHPYEKLNYVNANPNGWVMQMGLDNKHPFANFPTTLGGSSTTYYSDYYWQATGQRVVRVGGALTAGSDAGLSSWSLTSSSSNSYWNRVGRLLKKRS